MNLEYFKREKGYLRKIAHEFALKFPKVAGHLNLGAQDTGDPQVERLIESFAFLTGNIQQVIEGEFPEISTALLGILYPNLVNPIPPMSIAHFNIVTGDMPTGLNAGLHRGKKMFAETTAGKICNFRTVYDVHLVPIEVEHAGLEAIDRYSFLDKRANIGSVIRIRIKTVPNIEFPDFPLTHVRFYLNGDSMIVSQLYETLFCNLVDSVILPEGQEEPIFLPKGSITPVGFNEDENIIPTGANSHPAFGLLQEYFSFPDKFHFIDINNLQNHQSVNQFDLLLLLDSSLKLDISEHTFVPNCTPVVNLFEINSATIDLDWKKTEYHLIPSQENQSTTEVHSIIKVTRSNAEDEAERVVEPFYAFGHNQTKKSDKAYWYLNRKESWARNTKGTEVFLSFRDLGFEHKTPKAEQAYVDTLCTNRDLAEKIQAGVLLELEEKSLVQSAICLKKPTASSPPHLRGPTLWRLISNLSLNYLSLSGNKESLDALRSILRTYNFSESEINEQQIMGIRTMAVKKTLQHTGFEGWRGFRKGLEITLTIDPSYYAGSSAYLFVSVLRKFFSLYVSVNSFAETVLKRTNQEGEWKRWNPIKGSNVTL